jgi:GNAT superfamily N-acetyltransferase
VWRVTCFVVPVRNRRKGVAHVLLRGAIEFAREQGAAALEGQPVDTGGERHPGANLYHGTLSMFEATGFAEVARPRPDRPVMRLAFSRRRAGGFPPA